MEELKLNAINKAFGFPTEAVKPPSIDDVTRDILKVIQNPETLRAEQSKEIQHRYGQIFIDHWLRKQELRPIRVHPEQGPLLFLNSKKALPVPTEENFSVRDNLIVALEAVNNLLREQFLKSLKSCPHSNPLSLEVANSNHTAALRVGTHYHFFAAETITENFDQAKENINPKVLKTYLCK